MIVRIENIAETELRRRPAQGVRPGDRVFFPVSDNVSVAFWAAHYAAERIGAEVVPGGTLPSAQRVRKMDELRELVAELADANDAVREYGDEHGIPAVGRTAERVDGTIATLRQNVPGALSDREE